VETISVKYIRVLGSLVQKAGPYLLLEILLPGGTLFALLLFAYRRKEQILPALLRFAARVRGELNDVGVSDVASAWRGRHRSRDGLEPFAPSPL
jgi:hypothetical protein